VHLLEVVVHILMKNVYLAFQHTKKLCSMPTFHSGTVISGSLLPRRGASSDYGWRKGLQIWRVAANILNKQSQTADKGWSCSLGVGRVGNNSSP
jgi:hypothetical protein